ncbi:Mre11 DNA-binding presumed domain-containing protein [Scheffersomyces coipomensis]|uniref:Mre11 DNA-binding presumed domain-containing protein n=1 Tax=Scheffersomyces coipomensis TaxID=1788519 RepID=UPI00315C7A64
MPLIDDIEEDEDTIKILLTTDNHVGYNENDPIRGDDAWKTFNEITKLAKEHEVDLLVQGGDLFHINKPSKKSLFHVMKSLRLNCMGDKPCELELLSDPSVGLSNAFNTVNYEDPNLNISIPVFAISGNHDDATGDGNLSPLDVLSVTGLINHFGKVPDSESITVSPLLLQKGNTKLALYGMANVRDERLHRAFRNGIVKFQRPNIQTDSWFNLFCIHQNHAQHSITSSIPERFLPSFLDFILWGHEHECKPHPIFNPDTKFDVLQAGSSVATSLTEGEEAEKFAFIMTIKGKNYSIEPIKLKTVRPFIMKDIALSKTDLMTGTASKSDVIAYLITEVEKIIEQAKVMFKEKNPDLFDEDDDTESEAKKIPLPLVRLKVEYSGGYEIENPRRFSNRFVGKVANVDVIQFYKKRTFEPTKKTKFVDKDLFESGLSSKKATELKLQDLINEFLRQADLSLIPEAGINNAVNKYIESEDKNTLNHYIKSELKKETKMLLNIDIDDQEFHGSDEKHSAKVFKQLLAQIKTDKPVAVDDEEDKNNTDTLNTTKAKKNNRRKQLESDSEMEEEEEVPAKKTTRARKTPARSSKAKSTEIVVDDDSEDDDNFLMSDGNDDDDEEIVSVDSEEEVIPKKTRGRQTTAKAAKSTKRKSNLKDSIMRI